MDKGHIKTSMLCIRQARIYSSLLHDTAGQLIQHRPLIPKKLQRFFTPISLFGKKLCISNPLLNTETGNTCSSNSCISKESHTYFNKHNCFLFMNDLSTFVSHFNAYSYSEIPSFNKNCKSVNINESDNIFEGCCDHTNAEVKIDIKNNFSISPDFSSCLKCFFYFVLIITYF
jgi:hypothetical protein